jgi:hypothetical protein
MTLKTLLISAAVATGALAATAGSASAYVVCNRAGDCWHTTERYHYRPTFGLTIHQDNWRMNHRFHWREHDGRGYWRNGLWITF